MIPRGGGRSYGDSALATRVLSSRYLNDFITLDRRALTIRCGAGTTLAEILRVCVPQGLFLPVLSGTKTVTRWCDRSRHSWQKSPRRWQFL